MLEQLKKEVYETNMELTRRGLISYTWRTNAANAVHNAVVLEEVAKMALKTELNNPKIQPSRYYPR